MSPREVVKSSPGVFYSEPLQVYLHMDINRRKLIQKKFSKYTKSLLEHNAEIEELIDKKEEGDIMDWLDDL